MTTGESEIVTMDKMRKLLLEALDVKLDEKLQVLQSVKSDIEKLKIAVKEVGYQAEDSDSYNRKNCIVFHGIPYDTKEDPMDLAIQIGQALDIEVQPNDIDDVHRLRTRNPIGPSPLIVKYVNKWRRNAIMASTRSKGLNAQPWGGRSDQRIFANEHLTKRSQAILSEARKHKEFYSIWSWKGNIYYRAKLDGSETLELMDVEDAKTLSNQLTAEEKERIRAINKARGKKGKADSSQPPADKNPPQGVASGSRHFNSSGRSRSPYRTRSNK